MKLRKIPIRTLGVIIFPFGYIISLLVFRDPDLMISVLGLIGAPVWFVQWTAFLIGGWVLVITTTILFLGLFGYLFGLGIEIVVYKFKFH